MGSVLESVWWLHPLACFINPVRFVIGAQITGSRFQQTFRAGAKAASHIVVGRLGAGQYVKPPFDGRVHGALKLHHCTVIMLPKVRSTLYH